jgi:hypothetical protein
MKSSFVITRAGEYDLIGRKADSSATYNGHVTLRDEGGGLQVTRTVISEWANREIKSPGGGKAFHLATIWQGIGN